VAVVRFSVLRANREAIGVTVDERTIWHFGLSPWLIADGRFQHFYRGHTAEFRVAYWLDSPFHLAASATKKVRYVDDHRYEVTAEVTYLDKHVSILDCGILVSRDDNDNLPQPVAAGQFVTGDLLLGLDALEFAGDVLGPIYAWQIEGITRRITPYLPPPAGQSARGFRLDFSGTVRDEVESTNVVAPPDVRWYAGEQIEGASPGVRAVYISHAVDFILHCRLLGIATDQHSYGGI
jgi:hypothetical protein